MPKSSDDEAPVWRVRLRLRSDLACEAGRTGAGRLATHLVAAPGWLAKKVVVSGSASDGTRPEHSVGGCGAGAGQDAALETPLGPEVAAAETCLRTGNAASMVLTVQIGQVVVLFPNVVVRRGVPLFVVGCSGVDALAVF